MNIIKETRYLQFVEKPSNGKMKIIDIVNINHQKVIGQIKWFGRWRQYCFFPCEETVWNKTYMEDVYEVMNDLMEERKTKISTAYWINK